MQTILTLWNPAKSDDGFVHEMSLMATDGELLSEGNVYYESPWKNDPAVAGDWSVHRKHGIGPGDQVYMLLVGDEPDTVRGIVRRGAILAGPAEATRWDGEPGTSTYIRIGWNDAVPVDGPLATELLKVRIPEINWDRIQSSGMLLSGDAASVLDRLWAERYERYKRERRSELGLS